jgi:hypothetical protein
LRVSYLITDLNYGGLGKGYCPQDVWETTRNQNPSFRFIQITPEDYAKLGNQPEQFYWDTGTQAILAKQKITLVADKNNLIAGFPITWTAEASLPALMWSPRTLYTNNDLCIPFSPTGFSYRASIDPKYNSQIGTSGVVEPSWPLIEGKSVTDQDEVTITWGGLPAQLDISIGDTVATHAQSAIMSSTKEGQFTVVVRDSRYWSDPIYITATKIETLWQR